ncbi:MAG: response regulator transcription factor [Proteobacteria bacterium]|nr:response regulator transcription factor [Pseudomonadota bacterium]
MGAILLVEDDENLRIALCDNLEEEGYRVTAVADGTSAIEAVQRDAFDLVILDIMLPDIDGYALCERLRCDGFSAMILMLTARTLEDDLVRGLELGADDYLTKPYRLRELLARVQALLRRASSLTRVDVLRCGTYRIDMQAREVVDGAGNAVSLTRTEFDLLSYLVQNHGRAITRDELLNEVWGRDIAIDGRTVDNFISSLKKKLGRQSDAGFHIRTVRGVGYRMELDS